MQRCVEVRDGLRPREATRAVEVWEAAKCRRSAAKAVRDVARTRHGRREDETARTERERGDGGTAEPRARFAEAMLSWTECREKIWGLARCARAGARSGKNVIWLAGKFVNDRKYLLQREWS